MRVRTAHEERVLMELLKAPNVNVRWDVRPEVTDVARPVRVRQAARDEKRFVRSHFEVLVARDRISASTA